MGNSRSADADEAVGYRILGVQPNSPASATGLVSFFDFLVGVNGVPLKTLDNTLIEMIKASDDKPLPLTVYNCKSGTVRDVTIVPTRRWGGQGMLGVTIRFDSYLDADENLVRVLSVAPGGPAQMAGLQANVDYLLGTAEKVFKDPDALQEELLRHLEQPMELYVYNTETDEVRVAVVLPSTQWGGSGCLGAEVGHGLLHALPSHCRASTATSVGNGITLPVRDATTSPVAGAAEPAAAAGGGNSGVAGEAAAAAAAAGSSSSGTGTAAGAVPLQLVNAAAAGERLR